MLRSQNNPGYRTQALLLAILGFVLYANSIGNRYALDDGALIEQNEYVQQGIRGIPKILSTDSFSSLYRQLGGEQELSAGRYRPLSIVTFALDHQFFGAAPQPAHAVNVVLFALTLVVLLAVLRRLFPGSPNPAFLATFLFAIHPIHTEVVANIKSRDEILSLLFILLTFLFVLRHHESRKPRELALALGCYFLGLLSKEYGLSLLVLIPMALVLCRRVSLGTGLRRTLPFAAVAALYVLIRVQVVGFRTVESTEILNNPYLLASAPQKWATKLFVLLKYLGLLFWPYPLSADYSYRQIPYRGFGDPGVWLSILVHVALIAAGIMLWRRRNPLSWAIAFYLLNLFFVSNLLIDIGATMGERLIYHASVGFVLALAWGMLRGLEAARLGRRFRALRVDRGWPPLCPRLSSSSSS